MTLQRRNDLAAFARILRDADSVEGLQGVFSKALAEVLDEWDRIAATHVIRRDPRDDDDLTNYMRCGCCGYLNPL